MKTWRRGFVRKFSPANRMGEEKLSGIEIPFCMPVRTLDGVQALVPDQREPCCRPTPTAFHA